MKFQRPDGSWDSKSGFRTKDDALDHGREQEADVRRGVYIDPRDGSTTVAQFVTAWIDSIDVRPSSMRQYRSRLRAHILPRWGEDELRSVTPLAVRRWTNDLKKSGLAPRTVSEIVALLRLILEDAVAEKRIPFNPIPRASRRGRYEKIETPERMWATERQVLRLAENARLAAGLNGYALVLTLAYTGIRIAEMAGLRREHCHLLAKKHEQWIDIRQQAQYVDGEYSTVDCKFGSEREIIVPPFLADILSQQLAGHESEWLFVSATGKQVIVNGSWYERFWRPCINGRDAGQRYAGRDRPAIPAIPELAELDPHGLRHGHNVWLDEDFQHKHVAIEARMGHAVQGIKKVYSHVSPEMTRRISEKLQERWERSLATGGREQATGS